MFGKYRPNIVYIVLAYLVLCDGGSKKKSTDRIIDGRKAFIEEFPYQVSLEMLHQHICGGSIISSSTILTAAHCVDSVKDTYAVPHPYLLVRVGANVAAIDGYTVSVRNVRVYHGYSELSPTDTKDIALVYLMKPLRFSDSVQPISLAILEAPPGSLAWVTGYGSQKKEHTRKRDSDLMAVHIPTMNVKECRAKLQTINMQVADDMICAGYSVGHRDACRGDSGGPLAVNGELTAITAWGIGCGMEGIPGVYTSIPQYYGWIVKYIEP